MEGDVAQRRMRRYHLHFNPLPPHGGRQGIVRRPDFFLLFQSTPSAWRETTEVREKPRTQNISIHSLRMEGDISTHRTLSSRRYFNPLPPHGGRLYHLHPLYANSLFQSTPSAWRETICHQYFLSFVCISIHSLRMEGDSYCHFFTHSIRHFNPLPPHGGRLDSRSVGTMSISFQSTPSAWRET